MGPAEQHENEGIGVAGFRERPNTSNESMGDKFEWDAQSRIFLPVDVMVGPGVFGSHFEVSIGGCPAIILLPSPSGEEERDPSYFRLCGPPPEAFDRLPLSSLRPDDWGAVMEPEGAGLLVSVVVAFKTSDFERILRQYPSWFRAAADWLEALTYQGVAGMQRVPHPRGWLEARTRQGTPLHGSFERQWSEERLAEPMGGGRTVSLEDLELALGKASSNQVLPLEHSLLVDGLRGLRNFEDRRAIIEAATAVEVTLQMALRTKVQSEATVAVAESFLERRRTLGELASLCKQLDIWLPSGDLEVLVNLRNGAVHKGSAPGLLKARIAWEQAKEVLTHHVPLSVYGGPAGVTNT